jgi:hypothetical protein
MARQEIRRANDTDHWFELNWEYERAKSIDAVKLKLDSDLRPIDPSGIVHPARMCRMPLPPSICPPRSPGT